MPKQKNKLKGKTVVLTESSCKNELIENQSRTKVNRRKKVNQ